MNPVALQRAIDDVLARRRFDLVSLETPFIAPRLIGPDGSKPRVLIDAHNVEFDLARQYAERSPGVARRMFHSLNWPRLRAEEIAAWRRADAVAFTSPDDQARANALVPGLRSQVVPNGVDTDQFRPQPAERARGTPPTVVFFGTMNYLPNVDAVRWLLKEIWPAVAQRVPHARLEIIGSHLPPDVRSAQGPRIEVAGMVDDVRPHLEEAAAIVVPLRMGGGTRLKILESLAMGKAVVSTRLGAEGISAEPGVHLLLADEPAGLGDALVRVLEDPALASRLGHEGRELIAGTYSWSAIARGFEGLIHEVVGPPGAATARAG
jgi:glycosyltransferase involved in cell wall biosynthesis